MALDAGLKSAETGSADYRRWTTPVTASVVLIALTTVVLWQIDAQLNHEHLIFIYFLPTALVAIRYGSISAMGVTIASSFIAAYFLYPPRFSLFINNPLHFLELILFSLLALLASQVVSGLAKDGEVEKRRARRGWLALPALWVRNRLGS